MLKAIDYIYDVVESIAANRTYIDDAFAKCESKLQLPYRICIVGHGRSGKDTCAKILGKLLGYSYGGSTSYGVLPLITYILNNGNLSIESQQQCYADRHNNRKFWYDYCNLLRSIDPLMLLRLTLAQSDFVIGTRSKEEFTNSLDLFDPTTVIWMSREVPDDPTLEFDFDFVDRECTYYGMYTLKLNNNGTEADLEHLLKEYVSTGVIKGDE